MAWPRPAAASASSPARVGVATRSAPPRGRRFYKCLMLVTCRILSPESGDSTLTRLMNIHRPAVQPAAATCWDTTSPMMSSPCQPSPCQPAAYIKREVMQLPSNGGADECNRSVSDDSSWTYNVNCFTTHDQQRNVTHVPPRFHLDCIARTALLDARCCFMHVAPSVCLFVGHTRHTRELGKNG